MMDPANLFRAKFLHGNVSTAMVSCPRPADVGYGPRVLRSSLERPGATVYRSCLAVVAHSGGLENLIHERSTTPGQAPGATRPERHSHQIRASGHHDRALTQGRVPQHSTARARQPEHLVPDEVPGTGRRRGTGIRALTSSALESVPSSTATDHPQASAGSAHPSRPRPAPAGHDLPRPSPLGLAGPGPYPMGPGRPEPHPPGVRPGQGRTRWGPAGAGQDAAGPDPRARFRCSMGVRT